MKITQVTHGSVLSEYLEEHRPGDRVVPSDAVLVRSGSAVYEPRVNSWRIGGVAACDIRDTGSVQVRPWQYNDRNDTYYAGVLLAGCGAIAQRKRQVTLAPGQVVLYSRSSPFELEVAGPYHYLVLSVAARDLGLDCCQVEGATVSAHLAAVPAARVLAGILAGLPVDGPSLPPGVRLQLGDAVTGLLRVAVQHTCGPPPAGHGGEALFEDIVAWIEEHLGEPDLGPGRIAAAHHVSTRYVHLLFQQHGTTVGAHVLSRRIERIHQDLQAPSARQVPLAAVGRRWGIVDPSRLSKAFRRRYGVSPRDARDRWVAARRGASTQDQERA